MRHLMTMLAPVALFAAMPAAAQTAFPDWQAGNWEVYGDGSDCWIVYAPQEGTEISIAVARTDLDFYIGLKTPDTSGVTPKQTYPGTIRFGAERYQTTSFGMTDGQSLGTILDTQSPQMMPIFKRTDAISFSVRGKTFAVTLDPEAKAQFIKCEASIGGAGSAPEKD